MPKQPAFPSLRNAMKKKATRREQFLAQMEVVVPWGRVLGLIAPHYPKAGPKGGRPPMPLEVMLRVYFLQNREALSDPAAEETLYDSEAMRRFAGTWLGDDRIPDETTILNFRHLSERHGLTEAIFAAVNMHLADKGITLRSGTLVDVSRRVPSVRASLRKIIDAPSSTKNKAGARDPGMSFTKKGNDWFFGSEEDRKLIQWINFPTNAHVGVDAVSGVVHSLDTSTAKLHDARVRDALLHGEEVSVWAGLPLSRHWSERQWRRLRQRRARGGVQGAGQGLGCDEESAKGQSAASPRRTDQPHHRVASGRSDRWRNHWQLRAKVEHPFRVIKRQFGPLKTRSRGLARNRAQIFTLFALGNLFLVRRKLLA